MARPPEDKTVSQNAKLFAVAEYFLCQKMTAEQISSIIGCSRQAVYPMLAKACTEGFISLNPPVEKKKAKEIADKYHLKAEDLTVVDVTNKNKVEYVSHVAAKYVLDLIETLGRNGCNPVGLGLGPGGATLDFSRHLSHLIPDSTPLPKLKLFAISAGGPAAQPEFSSSSFFNLFPADAVAACVGLFAENLVLRRALPKVRKLPGVVEGFQQKNQINIIVTAMGDFEDEHDLLRTFLQKSGVDTATLKKAGWIGNVQYRPFTKDGPVKDRDQKYCAVTLFDLKEFVEIAKTKDRHVVLIARQCRECGHTRATALRSLLQNEKLKVWSHIIMDIPTANELLVDIP